jgi:atypical dual specificity phosphatase
MPGFRSGEVATWWIDEPTVLGSSNPTTDALRDLWDAGFRTVISLLNEREQRPGYNKQVVSQMGFVLPNVAITDGEAPSDEDFVTFLRLVDVGLSTGKVIVHCWGGCGRTGTMGAAYWVARGMSAADAMAKMRSANPEAIETKGQERSLDRLADSLAGGAQP